MKEVFIFRRLNRWGKRFGFVRFFNVGNARWLEKQLDKICIMNMKLHINFPKYRRAKLSQGERSTKVEKADRIHMEGRIRAEKHKVDPQPREARKQMFDSLRRTVSIRMCGRKIKGRRNQYGEKSMGSKRRGRCLMRQ